MSVICLIILIAKINEISHIYKFSECYLTLCPILQTGHNLPPRQTPGNAMPLTKHRLCKVFSHPQTTYNANFATNSRKGQKHPICSKIRSVLSVKELRKRSKPPRQRKGAERHSLPAKIAHFIGKKHPSPRQTTPVKFANYTCVVGRLNVYSRATTLATSAEHTCQETPTN